MTTGSWETAKKSCCGWWWVYRVKTITAPSPRWAEQSLSILTWPSSWTILYLPGSCYNSVCPQFKAFDDEIIGPLQWPPPYTSQLASSLILAASSGLMRPLLMISWVLGGGQPPPQPSLLSNGVDVVENKLNLWNLSIILSESRDDNDNSRVVTVTSSSCW